MATLGTEESGRYKEMVVVGRFKQRSMNGLFVRRDETVAVSGGSTVHCQLSLRRTPLDTAEPALGLRLKECPAFQRGGVMFNWTDLRSAYGFPSYFVRKKAGIDYGCPFEGGIW